MNLLQLSWKNITYKPLNALLSIGLFALGTGLIALILLLQKQVQDNFERNLAGVDLVLGAKGSPLQMILCNMYHIDPPTGNIRLGDAKPFLRPGHPIVADALPLSLGDNYRGFRIVGASPNILEWYDGELQDGHIWQHNFEATIGAQVAEETGLSIGDHFKSSHLIIEVEGQGEEHEHDFTVVGIVQPTGTVLDRLVLTTHQSYWLTHHHSDEPERGMLPMTTEEETSAYEQREAIVDSHDHEHEHDHDHEKDHAHDPHDHDYNHATDQPLPLLEEDNDKEITSVLLRFKSRNYMALNLGRNINENTDMQAATPAIETARLFELFGPMERALKILGGVIVFVSGLSIFISLFSSLRDRRYELALLRTMGASRQKVFILIVLEGMLLALIGCVLGGLLAHIGMIVVDHISRDAFGYQFDAWQFVQGEWYLLIGALVIGFLAAILPAVQASRTDISDTLAQK